MSCTGRFVNAKVAELDRITLLLNRSKDSEQRLITANTKWKADFDKLKLDLRRSEAQNRKFEKIISKITNDDISSSKKKKGDATTREQKMDLGKEDNYEVQDEMHSFHEKNHLSDNEDSNSMDGEKREVESRAAITTQMKSTIRELELKLKNECIRRKTMEEQNAVQNEKIKNLELEVQAMKTERTYLKKDAKTGKTSLSRLKIEEKQFCEYRLDKRIEIISLEKEITALGAENEAFRSKAMQYSERLQKSEKSLDDCQNELAQTKNNVQKLQDEKIILESKLSNCNVEQQKLKHQHNLLKRQKDTVITENLNIKYQKEKENSEAKKKYLFLRKKFEQLTSQKNDLITKLQHFKNVKEIQFQKIHNLQSDLTTRNNTIQRQKEQIDFLEGTTRDLDQKYIKEKRENARLKTSRYDTMTEQEKIKTLRKVKFSLHQSKMKPKLAPSEQ